MRRYVPVCALVLLITSSVPGQAKKKAPWLWTLDERIAERTNRDRARERVAAARARQPRAEFDEKIVDDFNGRSHPELFLPVQVFEELVMITIVHDTVATQELRDAWMAQVISHGLPADFWDRLKTITASYVAETHAVHELLRTEHELPEADRRPDLLSARHDAVCRTRADALERARQEFGRERLDRFLYEVMAVNMFSTAFVTPADPAVLRRVEEGCR